MRRLIAAGALVALMLVAVPALASHNADVHSDKVTKVATWDAGGKYRSGTDMAFWGTTAILGNYNEPGGFRIVDISNPAAPRQLGQFVCPGSQADVSIWENLVFVAVDSTRSAPGCNSGAALPTDHVTGVAWEGIRIVDISNPAAPKQIATVRTECGAHTNTIYYDAAKDRVLVYALSYPLGAPGMKCMQPHQKISVVEVPLSNPKAAKVVSTPSVAPSIGCHDVTILVEKKIAAAACISETQIWDMTDPVNPVIKTAIRNPQINIHHSSGFSNGGKMLIIADELGGAEATPGCMQRQVPLGALWFYDVSDLSNPVVKGSFVIESQEVSVLCTAHNFNVIPGIDRDVLVTGWYHGGTAIVDFTDPAAPAEIGKFIAKTGTKGTSWSSYWYNGYIYVNNFDDDLNNPTGSRGLDVLKFNSPLVAGATILPHLNVGLVPPAAVKPGTALAPKPAPKPKVLGTKRAALPRSGTGEWWLAAALVLGAALTVGRWMRPGSLRRAPF